MKLHACILAMNLYLSPVMPVEADIVLETPQHHRLLVVECKWMKEPSLRKAAELRDSLTPFWSMEFEYFMLVLRTGIHVWKRTSPAGSPPDFWASAKAVWRDYLGDLAEKPQGPRSETMSMAISSWLNDLANNVREPDVNSEADQMLVQSGLLGRMKNGVIQRHVTA